MLSLFFIETIINTNIESYVSNEIKDKVCEYIIKTFYFDLNIEKNELVDSGVVDEKKVDRIIDALTLHCQIAPSDNKYDILMNKARYYNKHPVAMMFRGIRWIK